MEELLGIPPRLLPYLEEDNLFQAVSSQRAPDQERTRITAELLELYGNIHGEMGSTAEEARLLHNALLLYLESYLSREASPEMEHSEAIDQLVQKLSPGSFSDSALFSLFQYYELTGRYRLALLILDRLKESSGQSIEMDDEYLQFYRRLSAVDPARLHAGGIEYSWLLSQMKQADP